MKRILTGREVVRWPEFQAFVNRIGIDLTRSKSLEIRIGLHDGVTYQVNRFAETDESPLPAEIEIQQQEPFIQAAIE
jgi:hypothetical protein